jgi:hypothetical protein
MPLTNPRFVGDAVLEACLAGQHRMMAPETGPAVAKVQQALIDLGFALPMHGADGTFSDETSSAVVAYKTEHTTASSVWRARNTSRSPAVSTRGRLRKVGGHLGCDQGLHGRRRQELGPAAA